MQKYLENDFNVFLLGILMMLVIGKLFGKCAKNMGFAEVTGEILAGILLGPTVLGAMNVGMIVDQQIFFSKFNKPFFNVFFQLSLVLMMFITGLKIDIKQATHQLKKTFYISFFGILFPFITGVLVAWFFQNLFILTDSKYPPFVFPVFIGIAYSISAIPVIAKILMDIKILHTPTGAIVISSAFLVDIICWGIFIIVTQFQSPDLHNLFIIFGCFLILFTLKKLIPVAFQSETVFKFFNKNFLDTDVAPSIAICLIICIAFQFLHLDACLGAFLAGILLNKFLNSTNSTDIKNILSHWVMNFFAPIFFVSIGIKIDFLSNFNWVLVSIIFFTCSLSKIAGCYIGAHLSDIKGIERIIISLSLNARGTMEIVFSTIALNLGIISNPTYVALVTMALATSILSGILLKKILYSEESKLFRNSVGLKV